MTNQKEIRVRFAPSPTGFLHIGGVRTALYNWLYARHHHGKFLLRIEDTDLERSEDRYTRDIMASMRWLGIDWDEEPLFQKSRIDLYRAKTEEMIQKGQAYRCTCTEEEIEKMRTVAASAGQKPRYNRHCRELNLERLQGKPHVIRLKTPLEGSVKFTDLIRGDIEVQNSELDDYVLIRSNGAPTYNLSVVLDDIESRITHVIRGDDHINNTPKQIHLYKYFNAEQPIFAHLPMILGPDKQKLSKRHGAVSANVYRSEGYLPEALLNFLVRLGWSHGDQEVFSVKEMIEFFEFNHVQKSSAVFNAEKLLWTNGEHIRACSADHLAQIVKEDYSGHFQPEALLRVNTPTGVKLISFIQPKVKLLRELVEQLVPLCTPGTVEVDEMQLKWNGNLSLKSAAQNATRVLTERLQQKIKSAAPVKDSEAIWGTAPTLASAGMNTPDVEALIKQVATESGLKTGDIMQPIRLFVTGRIVSAGLGDLMITLPWDVIAARLKRAQL